MWFLLSGISAMLKDLNDRLSTAVANGIDRLDVSVSSRAKEIDVNNIKGKLNDINLKTDVPIASIASVGPGSTLLSSINTAQSRANANHTKIANVNPIKSIQSYKFNQYGTIAINSVNMSKTIALCTGGMGYLASSTSFIVTSVISSLRNTGTVLIIEFY